MISFVSYHTCNTSNMDKSSESSMLLNHLIKNKSLPLAKPYDAWKQLSISFLIFPIWLCLLLPIALFSQFFAFCKKKLIISKKKLISSFYDTSNKSIEEILQLTSIRNETNKREYDLIVFGATGFTGRLAALYLCKQYGLKRSNFRWAIAGRRLSALQLLKNELIAIDPFMEDLDIIIADISDMKSLEKMISSTKVIITTAGPFSKYGSDVVRICASLGTHYCDITGETDFCRDMIDKYDDVAHQTGACIVHFCGHDCIPWDLSVLIASKELASKNDELKEIQLFDEISAQASGGTLATVFHVLEHRVINKTSLGYDPLLKNYQNEKSLQKVLIQNISSLQYSKVHKAWVGNFFMAMVMANCVRRSNALNKYSNQFSYCEGLVYPSFIAGLSHTLQSIYLGTCLITPILRNILLFCKILPSAGIGPSEKEMDKGFLKVTGYAKGIKGNQVKTSFYFADDPGYRDTARMLVESGLVLALQYNDLPLENRRGGVKTPATCQGELLLHRLVSTGSTMMIDPK